MLEPESVALAVALGWAMVVVVGLRRATPFLTRGDRFDDHDYLRRVARNAALPIASQLAIRAVDLAVAVALLRLLGPDGNGAYAVAVIVWLYVKTVSDFGLSLLATREVARDPRTAGATVGATTLLRWMVLALAAAPVAVYVVAGLRSGVLAQQSVLAIVLLYLSIVPSSFAEAINSALNGLERMDVAAWLNLGVSIARAPLAVALVERFGVGGVASAALVAAVASAWLLLRAYEQSGGSPRRWRLGAIKARWYLRESWPLLVNALLVNLFFRVDVFVVQAVNGDRALGMYDAAYKLINLLTIVPAYTTLAIFPILARRGDDHAALRHAQQVASQALSLIAWAAVVVVMALAPPLIRLLAGEAYLPNAANLLRILIWFAPLSFVNGVAQYVLVAAGLQRRIVPAFSVAVAFNLGANLLLTPLYGATAAAALTVATEAVILLVLCASTRGEMVTPLDRRSAGQLARPAAAGIAGAVVALALRDTPVWAAAAATGVYLVGAMLTGSVGSEERALLRRLAFRRTRQPT